MKSGLSIFLVTSELAPFSKTGGLADVSSALPRALAKLGCDIRILTPFYRELQHISLDENFSIPVEIFAAGRTFNGTILSQKTNENEPLVYFLQCPELFDRPGFYLDPLTGQDYADNATRFFVLSAGALDYCRRTDWFPDIVHANDWQTGLLPLLLRRNPDSRFQKSRSVFTIHNMAFQGLFDPSAADLIPSGSDLFTYGGPIEFYGKVSFLKAALEYADSINTVSPSYAHEIRSHSEFGLGLETVLQSRQAHLSGILNGIDTEIWNPETDSLIPTNYNSIRLAMKQENKKALCRRLSITYNKKSPLIGMISRIADQKGFPILLPALPDVLRANAQFVLLGSGDPQYERALTQMAHTHPSQMNVNVSYDEQLAHLIYAGADIFMMPSQYEPCGLSQMMSMRYGTVPIVRATGGLADTVLDADADPKNGTGFVFNDYDSMYLLNAAKRAINAFRDPARWRIIQRNGMTKNFSWDHSASVYLKLYRETLNRPPWRSH